jgi:hypothetical protein
LINGVRNQEILATADCIQKTFFISSAKIGIQFLGIGYFSDNGDKFPLGHFISKLENIAYKGDFKTDAQLIYDFFNNMSQANDTGQYVKGIMTGFENGTAFISTFNTYNDDYNFQQLQIGNQVDSEGNNELIPNSTFEAVIDIKDRIKKKETEKWWNIGGTIDILKITPNTHEFIEKNDNVFNGSQSELIYNFQNNLSGINGKIFNIPKILPYDF